MSAEKCLNLLELANRLCLPRLLNLIECRVIENLTKISQSETREAVELCLGLLEPVKVLNKNIKRSFIDRSTDILATQCTSISRVVHVLPLRQLQQHLPPLPEIVEAASSGKSGILARESLAAGLVSQGLRLLPAMHEGAEAGDEFEQKELPH